MPQQYTVGQHFSTTATETDVLGNPVPLPNPAALEWLSGNGNIIQPGAFDPVTGIQQWFAAQAGTTTVMVLDNSQSPALSFSDTVTIIDPPTAIKFSWGSPS